MTCFFCLQVVQAWPIAGAAGMANCKLAAAGSTTAETASAAPLTGEDGTQPVIKVFAYLNKRLTYAEGQLYCHLCNLRHVHALHWQHVATVTILEAQACFFSCRKFSVKLC